MGDSAPEFVTLKAIDVVPQRYGVWCTVRGVADKPFVNPIVSRRWLPNGPIGIMLDSFNFDSWGPDELVGVALVEQSEHRRSQWFEDKEGSCDT